MFGNFFHSLFSVVAVNSSPQLYRYPYRTSAEALRGDMKRIGKDIDVCFTALTQEDPRGE